eukprot:1022693-Prymnesium_polylepis.1
MRVSSAATLRRVSPVVSSSSCWCSGTKVLQHDDATAVSHLAPARERAAWHRAHSTLLSPPHAHAATAVWSAP